MPKPTPHDSLFKRVFARREDAIGELERVLPAELVAELELDALVVEDRSFVDPELVDRHTDQLYSVPIAGQPGFVYVLLEHKSRADRWTALWLLAYMVRIWEAFLKDEPAATELPPIIPLVLHHDESEWSVATSMHELFAPAQMASPTLAELTPAFRFVLDDISCASDDELRNRKMSTFARLALWALRDGRSDRLLHTLRAFSDYLAELLGSDAGQVDARTVLLYLYDVQGHATLQALADAIPSPQVREAAMTIAEQLRQEGLQQGLQQGQRAVLQHQLEVKFGPLDAEVRRRIEEADTAALERLAERVVTASSLEDVFEE